MFEQLESRLMFVELHHLLQVEAVLAGCPYVDNVMLHADPFHSYCVALIVANQAALEGWAKKAGVDYSDFADLCSKSETQKEVISSLGKVNVLTLRFDGFLSLGITTEFFVRCSYPIGHACFGQITWIL